jgi:DUF971 family protein
LRAPARRKEENAQFHLLRATAAMSSTHTPQPTSLTVHQSSRVLEVGFDDGQTFRIPFELLRIYSPSAEVQGHGPGQETLQTGKREVGIVSIEAVGHYAVQPTFDDGHDTGIFAWSYLYELGANQSQRMQHYLERLAAAGLDRDAPMHKAASGGSCASH